MTATAQHTVRPDAPQAPGLAELSEILDAIDSAALIERLMAYRPTGRKGYPLAALWRAYVASFVLDMPHTNALIRRLQDDAELRLLCGFGDNLPHRTTFGRFIRRLADHRDLVEACMAELTDQLADALPGFGDVVAIDSTAVRTHSNPNRKAVSDPDASWTAKNSAGSKDGKKVWHFGYKYHLAVDATYGLPIVGYTATASRNDSPELPKLLDLAASHVSPQYIISDKGYDSVANHRAALNRGAIPIIAIRNMPKGKLREGVYTNDCVPTCMGQILMEYVRSEPGKGHLYRCSPEGCHLKNRKGVRYCHDETWENRQDNPRLFGPIRRDSTEWKSLYRQRQSVERVFKSMKQSRRLESHCVRGLRHIALHAAMSALAFSATALVRQQSGRLDDLRWMVRRVA